MSLPEGKKKLGRPKGSQNKPKRTPMPIQGQKKLGRPKGSKNKPKEEKPIIPEDQVSTLDSPSPSTIKDEITEQKQTVQWIHNATRAKKHLPIALKGLKQLRERIDLVIEMTEKSKTLQHFTDALNGSINSTIGLIHCDEKNGWMDINYCNLTCQGQGKCYRYNTGRWICSLLRCGNEKITMCDERDSRCQAFDIVQQFADRYLLIGNRISHEGLDGDNN